MQTSEDFINCLIKNLQPYQKEIYGTIEPFCNNYEQGLMLTICNQASDEQLYIWACESKNGEDLMLIISNEKTNKNLYMESDIEKIEYFNKNNFNEAIDYSITQINKFLSKELIFKI